MRGKYHFGKLVFELQSLPFPRATAEHVGFIGMEALDEAEYVRRFLSPRITARGVCCVGCEEALLGLIVGTFEWGLANGEGQCGVCRWPTRMYHRFKDVGDGEERCVSFPLQYHPDELVVDKENEHG